NRRRVNDDAGFERVNRDLRPAEQNDRRPLALDLQKVRPGRLEFLPLRERDLVVQQGGLRPLQRPRRLAQRLQLLRPALGPQPFIRNVIQRIHGGRRRQEGDGGEESGCSFHRDSVKEAEIADERRRLWLPKKFVGATPASTGLVGATPATPVLVRARPASPAFRRTAPETTRA